LDKRKSVENEAEYLFEIGRRMLRKLAKFEDKQVQKTKQNICLKFTDNSQSLKTV
jgi:hypothetical protein